MADNDIMLIGHPDIPSARMETTEFYFRELWQARGWERIEATRSEARTKSTRTSNRRGGS